MKKLIIFQLLCLFAFSLTGCNKNAPDSTAAPTPTTGAVTNIAGSDSSVPTAPVTEEPSKAPTVLPTPTPEGNYVAFHLDSGFYESTQTVALSCNVAGASIYYTLDGSTPTKASTLYQNPITVKRKLYSENILSAQKNTSASNFYLPNFSVDKATVIRAVAYLVLPLRLLMPPILSVLTGKNMPVFRLFR